MFKKIRNSKGFTLIEVLLVVAIIAILAGIVILAVNPGKQLGDTRNAQRKSDVNTILNAVYQYSIDHQGNLPTDGSGNQEIPTSSAAPSTTQPNTFDVCTSTDATSGTPSDGCKVGSGNTQLVDLHVLTDSGKYLVAVPSDPKCGSSTSGNDSGYQISQDSNGRITVWAPCTEQGLAEISATR